MKKLIAVLAILGVVALNPGVSRADHDDDWAWFAGGAVAGLVTGAVLADSAYHHNHYYGCGHYGYGHGGYGYGYDYYPRYQHRHYYGCGHGHYGYRRHHGYGHRHHAGCGHYGYSEYYY
jgi:hypothetical protein